MSAITVVVDPLISPAKTAELVGLARGSLFEMSRQGRFPQPIKISSTRTAYSAAEIAEWIEARKNERGCDEMRRRALLAAEARKKNVAAGEL